MPWSAEMSAWILAQGMTPHDRPQERRKELKPLTLAFLRWSAEQQRIIRAAVLPDWRLEYDVQPGGAIGPLRGGAAQGAVDAVLGAPGFARWEKPTDPEMTAFYERSPFTVEYDRATQVVREITVYAQWALLRFPDGFEPLLATEEEAAAWLRAHHPEQTVVRQWRDIAVPALGLNLALDGGGRQVAGGARGPGERAGRRRHAYRHLQRAGVGVRGVDAAGGGEKEVRVAAGRQRQLGLVGAAGRGAARQGQHVTRSVDDHRDARRRRAAGVVIRGAEADRAVGGGGRKMNAVGQARPRHRRADEVLRPVVLKRRSARHEPVAQQRELGREDVVAVSGLAGGGADLVQPGVHHDDRASAAIEAGHQQTSGGRGQKQTAHLLIRPHGRRRVKARRPKYAALVLCRQRQQSLLDAGRVGAIEAGVHIAEDAVRIDDVRGRHLRWLQQVGDLPLRIVGQGQRPLRPRAQERHGAGAFLVDGDGDDLHALALQPRRHVVP